MTSKAHHAAYMRDWRIKNPEKYAATCEKQNKTRDHTGYMRSWREKNPQKVEQQNQRRRDRGTAKEYALKSRYGLTVADREAMFVRQGSACASCGSQSTKCKWVVDHCHATNKVRGVVCHTCNLALGYVNDSTVRLEKLIAYLRSHGGVSL